MDSGNGTTQGTPMKPAQQNRFFPFSSLLPPSITESQTHPMQTNSTNSFQFSRQFLDSFGTYNVGEPAQDDKEVCTRNPFRSEHSVADIQALVQHFLALTKTTASATNITNSTLDLRCGTSEKWIGSKDANRTNSPTATASTYTDEMANPVNLSCGSMSNMDNISRLASLSRIWSNSSPTAMAALAHLTLLGLPPAIASAREGLVANQCLNNDGNGSCSELSPKSSKSMQTDLSPNGCKMKIDPPASSSPPPQIKTETGSKIIIRQTADADEHFFKALRRLKVDVSPELQASDSRILSSNVPTLTKDKSPYLDQAAPPMTPACDVVSSQQKRTAAELAVDEHFEKSLGALPGFVNRAHESSGYLTPKHQHNVNATKTPCNINKSAERKSTSLCIDRISERSRFLVRQYSQHDSCPSSSTSPLLQCTTSDSLLPPGVPQPPPYSRQHKPYLPEHQDGRKPSPPFHELTGIDTAAEQTSSRGISRTVSPPDSLKITSNLTVPVTTISIQPTVNNFKPKKNWLAQYDGKEVHQTSGNISPEHTPYLHIMGTELSTGSPISSETQSEGSLKTKPCTRQQLEVDVDKTTESFEEVTPQMISSDLKQTKLTKHTQNSPLQSPPSETSQKNNDEQPNHPEMMEGIKNANEHTHEHRTCAESPRHSFSPNKTDTTETSHKDSATSPFSTTEQDCQSTVPIIQTVNAEPLIELPPVIQANVKTSAGISPISNSLSNPPSPCPVLGGESSVSAITPVSGTTSGFFSGSTYSLDSSFSQTQTTSFENKETDSGIDVKSLSPAVKERSLSESKSSHLDTDINSKFDNADTPSLLWSLRKRAASEASPWSTLKRSRSVLTSPISCNEHYPSCSPDSSELLNKTAADESTSIGTDRCGAFGEFTSRSVDGTDRPLTLDLPKSQTYKRLVHPRIVSEMDDNDDEHLEPIDSHLSRYYNLHGKTCEHKSKSEPSTLSNNPTVASMGRSLFDSATLPSLHLSHDENVYVLR